MSISLYEQVMRIVAGHDLAVFSVAITLCALGAFGCTTLGRMAIAAGPSRRLPWMLFAVLAASSAIWSSAVLTIMALRSSIPFAYDPRWLGLSFVVGSLLVGIAARITIDGPLARRPVLGGLVCGAAVVAVQAATMRSLRIGGTIGWDVFTLGAAIVVGIGLTAWSAVLWRRSRSRNSMGPIALFVVAVCSSHVIATQAMRFAVDDRVVVAASALDGPHVGALVALIGLLLLALTLVAQTMNRRDRVRRAIERDQVQQLVDIAVEGLVICDGPRIVWINRSLEEMLPGVRTLHVGLPLATLLQPAPDGPPGREIDASLRTDGPDGSASLPVRIIERPIRMSGRPHRVVAIRDQRERLRAEAEMKRLATTDALTGLANRARFRNQLADVFARKPAESPDGAGFALFAFDLDRFKSVNDSHGHAAGDAVLVEVARRLASLVRPVDLVARVGGDEFCILVATDGDPDAIPRLAQRAIDAVARPFPVEGRLHRIGVSVGVARARRDGDDAESLTRNADLALYSAKAAGRGTYRVFEERMRVAAKERHQLEEALRTALARNEFRLHFQPQVDARTGRYDGAEALIRWRSPVGGLVPPSAFIDVAEETGLIVAIGAWVIAAACIEAARWPDDLVVGVNLSAVQLDDPRLIAIVAAALATSGLPGRRLELEITESVLIADGATVRATLDGLKALGVRLALDDFGTGYSSLGHLHAFPFDKIKIDRSFIARVPSDPGAVAIVRAVVALGAGLGMRTSAEGVEDEEQRRFVVQAGCDQLQGFLIGEPVESSALPPVFRHQPHEPRIVRFAR